MSEALAVYTPEAESLSISRPPEAVLVEARKAAAALADVIKGKAKPVIFNGEQYLEYEDWLTVARFYGITAKVVSTAHVAFGDVIGFEARAEAIHATSGNVISAADSMCLNDEPNWKSKPLFQLRSMAQTRACAKALRNVLAWVVVLAGYRPTPAEEMDGVRGFSRPTDRPPIATPKPTNGGDNQAAGIVEAVTVKKGGSEKKPWTKYGVKLGEDWYSTFDHKHGADAEKLKGLSALVTWKQDGDFKTLVGIAPAPDAQPPERTAKDEQLDLEIAAKG